MLVRHYNCIFSAARNNDLILLFFLKDGFEVFKSYFFLKKSHKTNIVYSEFDDIFHGDEIISSVEMIGDNLFFKLRTSVKEGLPEELFLTFENSEENKRNLEFGLIHVLGEQLKARA